MATAPPTVTGLPAAPSTSSPATFDADADAFVAAQVASVAEYNALADNVYDNALDAAAQAVSAAAQVPLAAAQVALAAAQVTLATTQAGNADASRIAAEAAAAAAAIAAGAAIPSGYGQLFKTEGAANVKTGNFTGATGRTYDCNTTAGAFTATLHAAPNVGDFEVFSDFAGTFGTNNLTIARNGQLIAGLAENFICDLKNLTVTMVFVGGTKGWNPQ